MYMNLKERKKTWEIFIVSKSLTSLTFHDLHYNNILVFIQNIKESLQKKKFGQVRKGTRTKIQEDKSPPKYFPS